MSLRTGVAQQWKYQWVTESKSVADKNVSVLKLVKVVTKRKSSDEGRRALHTPMELLMSQRNANKLSVI
jgi:hypothetical protein